MASMKPGSVEQEQTSSLSPIEENLLSMENLDRSSPEMWPEKIPGMSSFMNNHAANNANKLPYSREFTPDDQNYLHQLATLSTSGLISKVKELHDIAYQLGVEESREIRRGTYLSLFSKKKKN